MPPAVFIDLGLEPFRQPRRGHSLRCRTGRARRRRSRGQGAPAVWLGETRHDRSRRKWKKVEPIEHSEYRAQHDHADGQPQDPRRYVVELIEAAIAFIRFHDVSPFPAVRGWRFSSPMIRHNLSQSERISGDGEGALRVYGRLLQICLLSVGLGSGSRWGRK
jgi:hypothetical protein